MLVSEELVAPVGSDVELCYQTFGSPDDDPLLLVMGLGGPMNWWDTELCRMLAQAGFFVIRYDNRDTGRSSRMPTRVRGTSWSCLRRAPTRVPYSISDLAGDAVALLDHLGLGLRPCRRRVDGRMIAQTMAIEHGPRGCAR